MDQLKIQGKLTRKTDVQQITDTFKKREFVITTDEQYPQTINFEIIQDRVNLIDGFEPGEDIEVYFNLRGREWQKDANAEVRVFNSLHAWRIQKLEAGESKNTPPSGGSSETQDETRSPF